MTAITGGLLHVQHEVPDRGAGRRHVPRQGQAGEVAGRGAGAKANGLRRILPTRSARIVRLLSPNLI